MVIEIIQIKDSETKSFQFSDKIFLFPFETNLLEVLRKDDMKTFIVQKEQ